MGGQAFDLFLYVPPGWVHQPVVGAGPWSWLGRRSLAQDLHQRTPSTWKHYLWRKRRREYDESNSQMHNLNNHQITKIYLVHIEVMEYKTWNLRGCTMWSPSILFPYKFTPERQKQQGYISCIIPWSNAVVYTLVAHQWTRMLREITCILR